MTGLEAERRRRLTAARREAERLASKRARAQVARDEEAWASMDPDDRLCMEAHGFTLEDDFMDPSVFCRNGCGVSYGDVVAGKIRECRAST